jgi:hypothetical protein
VSADRLRDLNYLAILAGLCSISAASLGRDVFAVLFGAAATFLAYAAWRLKDKR